MLGQAGERVGGLIKTTLSVTGDLSKNKMEYLPATTSTGQNEGRMGTYGRKPIDFFFVCFHVKIQEENTIGVNMS